jgi:hypothetical protein
MASPSTQTANAIRAITERSNIVVPEIDFTVHELENGEIVRTDQRVVKDVSLLPLGCDAISGICLHCVVWKDWPRVTR